MMKMKINPGIILANLIVMTLAIVSYLNLNTIQPLYPFKDMVTDDRTPTFTWSGFGQEYELLLDDNPGFVSSLSRDVSGNSHTVQEELEFGTYWWKVRSGEAESEARHFTLVSTVALSRLEPNPNLIKNSGNTALLVHRGGLAGAVTLAMNHTIEIGEREDVKAEQK